MICFTIQDSAESENQTPAITDSVENLVISSTTMNQLQYNSSDCSRTRPDLCGLHSVDGRGVTFNASTLNASLSDVIDENGTSKSSSGKNTYCCMEIYLARHRSIIWDYGTVRGLFDARLIHFIHPVLGAPDQESGSSVSC